MSSTTRDAERPKRNPHSAFRAVGDDGGLVVLPGKAEVKVLNPVGIKVFSLLDGNHTTDEIVDAVVEEFEAPREAVLKDVHDFVEELDRHGMLLGDEAPEGTA